MKKFIMMVATTASAAIACVSFSSTAYAGAVLDHVLSTKTLTIATSVGWIPSSFINDKGELDGFDVEVAKGVAKYLGVEAKFVTPEWNIVTSAKWEGRWDLTMGQMTPTEARAKKFDFAAVYFYSSIVAVVHKDSKATKPSDLDGKVVGVTAGGSEESYAKHELEIYDAPPVQYQFKPGEVKSYDGTSASDDLRLGDGVRLNGMITDAMWARESIKAGYPIKIVGGSLAATPGVIAILPGDKEFSAKIADAIKTMRDDGSLSKLSIKWYGSDYTTGM